jgi:hypothetical protein
MKSPATSEPRCYIISASIQPAIWNAAMKKPILYVRNEPAVITKTSEVAREKPSRIAISNRDSAGNINCNWLSWLAE